MRHSNNFLAFRSCIVSVLDSYEEMFTKNNHVIVPATKKTQRGFMLYTCHLKRFVSMTGVKEWEALELRKLVQTRREEIRDQLRK